MTVRALTCLAIGVAALLASGCALLEPSDPSARVCRAIARSSDLAASMHASLDAAEANDAGGMSARIAASRDIAAVILGDMEAGLPADPTNRLRNGLLGLALDSDPILQILEAPRFDADAEPRWIEEMHGVIDRSLARIRSDAIDAGLGTCVA